MVLPPNCLKSEKSENKQFQFSVWKNGEYLNVNLKKFKRLSDGRINYLHPEEMNFSVQEFELFKAFLKTIKKKKT